MCMCGCVVKVVFISTQDYGLKKDNLGRLYSGLDLGVSGCP